MSWGKDLMNIIGPGFIYYGSPKVYCIKENAFLKYYSWLSTNATLQISTPTLNHSTALAIRKVNYIYAFSRCFYPKRFTVHSDYICFCQYVCSLGIKPTTFAVLTQCSNHWATGTASTTINICNMSNVIQKSNPRPSWATSKVPVQYKYSMSRIQIF